MSIEKPVPTFADLEVFMQLLSRPFTAECANSVSWMRTGVREGA